MRHSAGSGGTNDWTRRYNHDTAGNRLWSTSQAGETSAPTYTDSSGPMPAQPPQYSDQYSYDVHGNMLSMPHVSAMTWNALDELESAAVGSTLSHYQYGGGQRVRKFVESTSGSTTTDERIYIGPFELYRRSNSGGVQEEIESLNVSDDTGRMLLIETKTVDSGTLVASPIGRWRYQLSNHLGSASTEVDEGGAIISYEEYHPYGTTAYRAANSAIEVSAKRYRYTGKEKDEETGLYYHGARYYACWLARWTAADPIGLGDGVNRFAYVSGNPVRLVDPSGARGENLYDENGELVGRSIVVDTRAAETPEQTDARLGLRSGSSQANRDFTNEQRRRSVTEREAAAKDEAREAQTASEEAETAEAASFIVNETRGRIGFAVIVGGTLGISGGAALVIAPATLGASALVGAGTGAFEGASLGGGLTLLEGGSGEEAIANAKRGAVVGGASGAGFGAAGFGVGALVSRVRAARLAGNASAPKPRPPKTDAVAGSETLDDAIRTIDQGERPKALTTVARTTQEKVAASAGRPISGQGNVAAASRKMQRRQSDPRRRPDDPFNGIRPVDAPELVGDIVATPRPEMGKVARRLRKSVGLG